MHVANPPRLAGYLGIDLENKTVATVLMTLVNEILQPTQEELIQILEKRLKEAQLMASTIQFLQDDDVQDMLSKDDAKEASKEVEAHAKAAEVEGQPLKVSIRALRKKLQDTEAQRLSGEAASSSGARGRGRGRGRSRGSAPQLESKPRYPTQAPPGERLDLTGARALLPAGCRLHEDDFNARYQVFFEGTFIVSRSWRLYTRARSLQMVVAAAWAHWESLGNEPCPIANLLSWHG